MKLIRRFKERKPINSPEVIELELQRRDLFNPKWSTAQEAIKIALKLSNRYKITTVKCFKILSKHLQRAKLQCNRNSTFDPYVKVILKPLHLHFKTLPIYGGGCHVAYTQYDQNVNIFEISEEQLIEMNCTLHIIAFDSDVSSNDNFIGENEIILNTESGLLKDVHLFSTIPIASSSKTFTGKIEISVLWTNEYLKVSVLNATHLRNQEYKRVNEDKWLVIRCIFMFMFIFALGLCLFCWTESWDVSVAIWFLIVTTTTVGYGDIVPESDLGKILNCFYLILSTIFLGWVFSVMMNIIVSVNSSKLSNELTMNAKIPNEGQNLETFERTLLINLLIMIALVLIACIFFTFVAEEQWRWIDSLTFAIATMSTVGYGDKTPKSHGGRAFAAIFMIFGTILLARFAANIMDYLLIKRHENMVKKIMDNTLITKEQIQDFDADGSGHISKFEYLSKMLILTNEVKPAVIHKIMNRFNELDVDKDGGISVGDFEIQI